MSGQVDREVLWVGNPKDYDPPRFGYALLWPAIEFTALVYARPASSGINLDPFERAVLGVARNGRIEVRQQAELLGLNEQFVAHLSMKLMEKGLLTKSGRPTGPAVETPLPPIAHAVRMYQDPFSGAMWPRFTTEQWRRTLLVETRDGRPMVIAGSTGEPIVIRGFQVRDDNGLPPQPTSDDAANALRFWAQQRRGIRLGGLRVTGDSPVKLLPDTSQLVYLCCPNRRGRPRRPDLDDPFGGPTWSQFTRMVLAQTENSQPLARWLYDLEAPTADSGPDENGTPAQRMDALAERIAESTGRNWQQLRLDLLAFGNELVDALWAAGTEDVRLLMLDPLSDQELVRRACAAVGFEVERAPRIRDLGEAASGDSLDLGARCGALCLRFPTDVRGPLHGVAERCPDLFDLLGGTGSDRWSRSTAEGLVGALAALTEAVSELHIPRQERETESGQE